MSENTTPKPAEELKETLEEKICFIVMPISDQEGYDEGHFDRVYQELIKPAVEKAGLKPIRADEEQKTNDIRIDLIRKIIESDHVLCDLSSCNANVFYELGIRQAFDKSVTLIKDKKTRRMFDVASIRTNEYCDSLRIDKVKEAVNAISISIKQTVKNSDSDSIENSIIKQLSIKAAEPGKTTEVSYDTKLILDKLERLEQMNEKPRNYVPKFKAS
ncbi:hypothetical protein [Myroides odoratimimus]|uniref:Nucleoside 2-deoxyribosyltransferase n=1 Tax=Myroides odoratimimus TaxID=76832 RepID=A0AAI8C1L4_9FLAO|nr:hypothetical protein [Myroides odoratimimus]ALU25249.1 hypothetical protein AS202_03350 [Myroides odoratimimus]